MTDFEEVPFENIDFETGDLILFHNNLSGQKSWFSAFLDWCIDFFTQSKFNHAGMIVKDPDFGPKPLKGIYLIESTGLENIKDSEDREIKFGVQLRYFREIIDNFDGQIYYRKLVNVKRDENFYDLFRQAHSVAHNCHYDMTPGHWLKALFKLHIGKLQDKSTFFCSALCSYIYTCIEILPSSTCWSIISPSELSTEPGHLEELDKYLEREVIVKINT